MKVHVPGGVLGKRSVNLHPSVRVLPCGFRAEKIPDFHPLFIQTIRY